MLWQSKYNPIKREVLYQSEYAGRLGIDEQRDISNVMAIQI